MPIKFYHRKKLCEPQTSASRLNICAGSIGTVLEGCELGDWCSTQLVSKYDLIAHEKLKERGMDAIQIREINS